MVTEADVKIAYGARRTFKALEEGEIGNEETNNDSSDGST